MGDPVIRLPESETVIEGIRRLVLELHGPLRAAVFRLVDAEVSGVVPDRHQIRHAFTDALHIPKLQALGPWHNPGFPGRVAIGRYGVRPSGSRRPHHPGVHRTNSNQQLRGAALL